MPHTLANSNASYTRLMTIYSQFETKLRDVSSGIGVEEAETIVFLDVRGVEDTTTEV